jgi:hypothetical protein
MKGKWRRERASSQDDSLWWKHLLVVMTMMMSIIIDNDNKNKNINNNRDSSLLGSDTMSLEHFVLAQYLQNTRKHTPSNTAAHTKTAETSEAPLQEPQTWWCSFPCRNTKAKYTADKTWPDKCFMPYMYIL